MNQNDLPVNPACGIACGALLIGVAVLTATTMAVSVDLAPEDSAGRRRDQLRAQGDASSFRPGSSGGMRAVRRTVGEFRPADEDDMVGCHYLASCIAEHVRELLKSWIVRVGQ
jgi:hypothetical protein